MMVGEVATKPSFDVTLCPDRARFEERLLFFLVFFFIEREGKGERNDF